MPRQFGNAQIGGGPEGNAPPVDPGVYYATKHDIELIYGKTNVEKWADIDNNEIINDIAARINWALMQAHNYCNDRLVGSPYTIPFVLPYPVRVTETVARHAGVLLYDARGLVDATDNQDGKDTMTVHRKTVDDFYKRLLADQIRLYGYEHAKNYPFANVGDNTASG